MPQVRSVLVRRAVCGVASVLLAGMLWIAFSVVLIFVAPSVAYEYFRDSLMGTAAFLHWVNLAPMAGVLMISFIVAVFPYGGRSVVMRVLRLRLISVDGASPTRRQRVGRWLALIPTLLLLGVPSLVGVIFLRGQPLHDLLSGTTVTVLNGCTGVR